MSSRPRSRVLARAETLFTLAPVVFTGCVPFGVVDPIPDPATEGNPQDNDANRAKDVPPVPPDPDPGYGVVDPMPPPARDCETFVDAFQAVVGETEPGVVQVTVLPWWEFRTTTSVDRKVTVTDGTLLPSPDYGNDALEYRVRPDDPAAGFSVRVTGTCSGRKSAARAVVANGPNGWTVRVEPM